VLKAHHPIKSQAKRSVGGEKNATKNVLKAHHPINPRQAKRSLGLTQAKRSLGIEKKK